MTFYLDPGRRIHTPLSLSLSKLNPTSAKRAFRPVGCVHQNYIITCCEGIKAPPSPTEEDVVDVNACNPFAHNQAQSRLIVTKTNHPTG